MKVEFNRAALLEALGMVTQVVPARTPKPILKCVKISTDGDVARLAATDLEVGLNCTVSEVSINQPGQVVIPAEKLAAIARESIDEVLLLEASSDDKCEVRGSDSHFTIYAQPAEAYPTVPSFDGDAELEAPLGRLRTAIEQCIFATAKESTRYALNGVLWETKGKKLILVATDGRRLVRVRLGLASEPKGKLATGRIIVPTKAMSLLDRLAAAEEDIVQVKQTDNRITIRCGSIEVCSNLVEGSFPKYEDIIPTDYQKKLTLPTAAALSAVRRAALLTSEESRGIRLSISKDKIVFSGRAPETGDAEIEMAVDYKAEPIEIGFNPQFIIDVLRVLETEEFELELGEPDRPGLIKSGSDFLYVLMPISLS